MPLTRCFEIPYYFKRRPVPKFASFSLGFFLNHLLSLRSIRLLPKPRPGGSVSKEIASRGENAPVLRFLPSRRYRSFPRYISTYSYNLSYAKPPMTVSRVTRRRKSIDAHLIIEPRCLSFKGWQILATTRLEYILFPSFLKID